MFGFTSLVQQALKDTAPFSPLLLCDFDLGFFHSIFVFTRCSEYHWIVYLLPHHNLRPHFAYYSGDSITEIQRRYVIVSNSSAIVSNVSNLHAPTYPLLFSNVSGFICFGFFGGSLVLGFLPYFSCRHIVSLVSCCLTIFTRFCSISINGRLL